MPNNNNPKFSGGWFDVLHTGIQTGLPLALGYLQSQGTQSQGKICGTDRLLSQGEIAGCIDQLYRQWQAIESQIGEVPNANILTAFQAVIDMLNNDAFFAQNSGDAYLSQAKTNFANWLVYYKNKFATASTATTAQSVLNALANPVAADTSLVNGVPNIYLLGAAGVVLGLVFLRKG